MLGDPRLRTVSEPVEDTREPGFLADRSRLQATLEAFRARHGFGRAIAAPQIGVAQRFIASHLAGGPLLLVNPEIVWRSDETFTLWDDCMCFPQLLVRVRRHCSISVAYVGEDGSRTVLEQLDRTTSELLQHEIDHLDGVLAVDRALDERSLVMRSVYESMPEHFAAMVDGAPAPFTTSD
jgi:peptide deformylase